MTNDRDETKGRIFSVRRLDHVASGEELWRLRWEMAQECVGYLAAENKRLRQEVKAFKGELMLDEITSTDGNGCKSKLDEWQVCYAGLFRQMQPLQAENKQLKDRLEVNTEHDLDGIECKNTTIKWLEKENKRLCEDLKNAKLDINWLYEINTGYLNGEEFKHLYEENKRLRDALVFCKDSFEMRLGCEAQVRKANQALERE